jgi:hypothetical protein
MLAYLKSLFKNGSSMISEHTLKDALHQDTGWIRIWNPHRDLSLYPIYRTLALLGNLINSLFQSKITNLHKHTAWKDASLPILPRHRVLLCAPYSKILGEKKLPNQIGLYWPSLRSAPVRFTAEVSMVSCSLFSHSLVSVRDYGTQP